MSTTNHRMHVVSAAPKPASRPSWRRISIYVMLVAGSFLLGMVPMWLKARHYENQRDAAQTELRRSEIQNKLSAAVIEATRGMFEPARQTSSDFFTALRNQIDAGDNSALTPLQREKLKPLLARRDDVITMLARSDASAANQLSDMYVAYRAAMTYSEPRPGS